MHTCRFGRSKHSKLRQCGLNYELHPNGTWISGRRIYQAALQPVWRIQQPVRKDVLLVCRRSRHADAGAVSTKTPASASGLSIYEQVNNASLFSLYLPIANEADAKNAFRNYSDTDFYHTLLMSNHMELNPREFAEGIRGKDVVAQRIPDAENVRCGSPQGNQLFPAVMFAGAFNPTAAPAPFHNSTCDGCHLRNGSGIPINTAGTVSMRRSSSS